MSIERLDTARFNDARQIDVWGSVAKGLVGCTANKRKVCDLVYLWQFVPGLFQHRPRENMVILDGM